MGKIYVSMTDTFMSGWGRATGKTNRHVVECDTWPQADAVKRAACDRSEMKRVIICLSRPRQRPGYILTSSTFADLGGPWLTHYRPEDDEEAARLRESGS